MGMTISRNRFPRGFIIRSITLVILLLVIFQSYLSYIQSQSSLRFWSSPATSNPNAKYLGTNNDELTLFPPTRDLERFCSSYPKRPTKKHHILISNKAKEDGPLKIFYWKQRALTQRVDWHKESETIWALVFFDESIGFYPYVAMPAFLNQFDITIGSPPQLMDVPNPSYPITEKKALELANIEPTHPFDKTPEHYIAFMVSNCYARNDRMTLINKLVKTAGAHSYGECSHNKEMPEELKGRETGNWQYKKQKVLASYPFGLAAENSNCLGYITEKIYDVYAAGSIPIYMGAPDIADFVPEGSFIDARSFKNYDDLIHYMKTVDREPFYRWKDIVKKDPTKFCKKCLYAGPTPWCSIMDNVHFV
ncbi:Alpha 1,3 fucosyltransferase [Linnemannia elongata]|nr:Alpha 1,3 fucosyltransferase [Linnemannia elongata]